MKTLTELANSLQLRGAPLRPRNNYALKYISGTFSGDRRVNYAEMASKVYADCNCDAPDGSECDCVSDDCSDDD